MVDVPTVKLGSLGASRKGAFSTGPFGSAVSAKNFRARGVPMIRGTNLSGDIGVRLEESEIVFVEAELASQFSRAVATRDDLVFTCWGTVGQVGLIDGRCRFDRYLVSNKQMKMTPDPDRVSSLFLYYYLSQPRMQRLVQGQAIGSSVPGFNLGQLKSLPIQLPSLKAQTSIAEVLGALDDKIAANTRLAHTVAGLASLTYEKARSGATDVRRLNECATTQYGITTSAVSGDGPRLLRVTDINKKPWIDWAGAPGCKIDAADRAKYGVTAGDILVARMADPGKAAYIDAGDPEAVFASYLVRAM